MFGTSSGTFNADVFKMTIGLMELNQTGHRSVAKSMGGPVEPMCVNGVRKKIHVAALTDFSGGLKRDEE
jgi:hypothetical protein